MNPTTALLAWFILGIFTTCHSAGVLGFLRPTRNLPGLGASTTDEIENYGDVESTETKFNDESEKQEYASSRTRRTADEDRCDYRNISEVRERPQRIREIFSESSSFYLRPMANFRKFILQLKLQAILDVSDQFYADERIELYSWDLDAQENGWVKIHVQYYHHVSTGPNSHGLRVTIGNTTHSVVSDHWRLLYTYEGFLISTDGGVELLFNCSPEEYSRELSTSSSSSWKWLLGSCFITVAILASVLFCVCMFVKKHRTRPEVASVPSSQVYEEFDEEVLAKIRQKVEILREGRGYKSQHSEGIDNRYVLQVAPLQRPSNPEEDHYKLPRPIEGGDNFQERVRLRENEVNQGSYLDENHYETLYPLNNSTTLNNGNRNVSRLITSATPRHNSLSDEVGINTNDDGQYNEICMVNY